MTALHPLPPDAIATMVAACVQKLTAARLAEADVVTAAQVFERVLRRARVGIADRPSSNGHQHPHDPRTEGD